MGVYVTSSDRVCLVINSEIKHHFRHFLEWVSNKYAKCTWRDTWDKENQKDNFFICDVGGLKNDAQITTVMIDLYKNR